MKTIEILETASKLVCGDRQKTHGDKYANCKNMADIWNSYLGDKLVDSITAKDAAIMMALVKIARTKTGTHNEDDYVDGAAYVAIACEVHDVEDSFK